MKIVKVLKVREERRGVLAADCEDLRGLEQKMGPCLRVCCQSVFVDVLRNANVVCEPLRGLDSCLRRNDRVVSWVWQQ